MTDRYPLSRTALLLYHNRFPLSTPFSHFFHFFIFLSCELSEVPFASGALLSLSQLAFAFASASASASAARTPAADTVSPPPRRDSLPIIPPKETFVNTFFHFFFSLFFDQKSRVGPAIEGNRNRRFCRADISPPHRKGEGSGCSLKVKGPSKAPLLSTALFTLYFILRCLSLRANACGFTVPTGDARPTPAGHGSNRLSPRHNWISARSQTGYHFPPANEAAEHWLRCWPGP